MMFNLAVSSVGAQDLWRNHDYISELGRGGTMIVSLT
jgi:uncharacterized protein YlxP (DUF503 family)